MKIGTIPVADCFKPDLRKRVIAFNKRLAEYAARESALQARAPEVGKGILDGSISGQEAVAQLREITAARDALLFDEGKLYIAKRELWPQVVASWTAEAARLAKAALLLESELLAQVTIGSPAARTHAARTDPRLAEARAALKAAQEFAGRKIDPAERDGYSTWATQIARQFGLPVAPME